MTRGIKHRQKAKSKTKKRSESSSSAPQVPVKVWQPGVDKLEEDEELQCDPSAYNSLHAFHIGWPCLSFDILCDTLGLVRTEFPHTVYFMAGTQAEKPSWNSIGIFKVSNISGKRRELVPKHETDDSGVDGEDSDSEDDSDDEEEGGATGPTLQLRKVTHEGCINRIRAMAQNPHICATWAESGHVQIWDMSSHLNALAETETEGVHPCTKCSKQCRTKSELRKHMLKHTLPYHCDVRGCSRDKGFTSRNDLDRHKRTVHADRSVAGRFFVCTLDGCAKKKHKVWPRADNFRCHLSRVHGKQYRADDDLTEYVYRSPPPSQDLQGVGGSAMDYMPSQGSHFALPPSSEIMMPPAFRDPYNEESRRRALQLQTNNESLPRISTSISFDRDSSNLAPVQEGDGLCIAPGYLNGAASNTGISLSPTGWQPSNPSEQNLSGGSQSAFGSEPQGTAPSMTMEDTSRDNQSDIGVSGTQSSNTEDQEPEQPDVRMTDADDTPAATSTPRGQAAKDSSSPSRESVKAVLDKIPKDWIENYLKVKDGSAGSKDDASKEDTAVGKGQNQMHKCPECIKAFPRQCELKKHLKRHSKPYGCTFPNCRKVFGSKNDWKRHESIQHYQLETWNCDHPKPNSTEVCGKVCHRRESFRNHLTKEHAISDSAAIEEKLDCCRKGRHCDVKFWCGFCVEIIEITEAENAWAKRCDHIDDHFCGRGQLMKRISEWKHEDPKDNEASPTRETEPDSPPQSSASNTGPRSPNSSTPTAEAKKSTPTQYFWVCCNCSEYHNYTSRTTNPCFGCNHNRCTGCKISGVSVNDERLALG